VRSARILATGVAALLAVLLIATHFRETILGFAASIMLLVVIGFVIGKPRTFTFLLPAVDDRDLDQLTEEMKAQPYPQLFVFRADIRNLFLLLVSPLYAMGLTACVLLRPDLKWEGNFAWDKLNGFLGYPVGAITSLAVLLAWTWAAERLLLRRCQMRLGIIHSRMGEGSWSYEYFDVDGERRGGTAFPWNRATHSVMPVFVHSKRGDWSKPGFGFIFHEFVLTESRHLPGEFREAAHPC